MFCNQEGLQLGIPRVDQHLEDRRPQITDFDFWPLLLHIPDRMRGHIGPYTVSRHHQRGPPWEQHVLPNEICLVADLIVQAVQLETG